ncbi:8634_t:CDS:10, partial [Scutellospora calospora]
MIFTSKFADITIPQLGIYQYVTSNPNNIPDDKVVYVDGVTNKSYTFGEFKCESAKFAAGLQDKIGFKRGDVLAIFSPNQVDYPIVLLGTIAAGGKVTTANPKYRAKELEYQLINSGASVLIVHPEFLESALEASNNAKIPTSRIFLFGDKEIKGLKPYRSILLGDREIVPVSYTSEEVESTTAYIPYSSGTTGKQKGVELTHKNMVANLAQLANLRCKLGPDSVIMGVLPFFHIYSLTVVLHATLIHGATAVILSSFNVNTFCESIQNHKVSYIYAVPPIILRLLNDPLAKNYDLSSVDLIVSAAAPLGDNLEKKFFEIFKIPIMQAYGLTETSPIVHYSDSSNIIAGSIGRLLPNVKAKILSDDGHGNYLFSFPYLIQIKLIVLYLELGYNDSGTLHVHGPNIMKGYLKNKEATDAVFDNDGFFNTGDIASVDEQGNFYIVDREKELIKYNGFQVAPAELESVLLTHEVISDAAVIGYYSEKDATEIPVAYVTIKDGHEQSQTLAKDIQSFVENNVAPHKKLRGGILFIDKIPKSDSGKILRRLLRERVVNDL